MSYDITSLGARDPFLPTLGQVHNSLQALRHLAPTSTAQSPHGRCLTYEDLEPEGDSVLWIGRSARSTQAEKQLEYLEQTLADGLKWMDVSDMRCRAVMVSWGFRALDDYRPDLVHLGRLLRPGGQCLVAEKLDRLGRNPMALASALDCVNWVATPPCRDGGIAEAVSCRLVTYDMLRRP